MPVDQALLQRLRDRESKDSSLNILNGLDGNKDQAAHAIDIEKRTGADSEYTYHNYPEVTKTYRNDLVQGAVDNDDMMRRYINSHPLASTVSKDDVSNLVTFSQAWKGLKNWTAIPWTIYASANLVRASEVSPDALGVAARHMAHAVPGVVTGAGVGALAGLPFGGIGTVPGALVGAGAGLIAGGAESLAQSWVTQKLWPEEAERLARGEEEHPYAALVGGVAAAAPLFTPGPMSAKALLQSAPIRALAAGVMGGITLGEEAIFSDEVKPRDAIAAAIGAALFAGKATPLGNLVTSGRFVATHIKNGEYPPTNVWQPWDKVVIEDTKAGMKQYDEVMKAAGKSETREISPEMWEAYLDTKDSIGLKFKAAQGLYGDKLPTPGDGLLGDVPGINAQWKKAAVSGEDIKVPWTHWSRVEKEIEKSLHDFVRLRDELMTLDETKQVTTPEPAEPSEQSPTQQTIKDTRKSMGIEPLQGLLEPSAVMPSREQARMLKAINDINNKDIEAEVKLEKRKVERELSEGWNQEAAELHPQVSNEIENRPDFAAWRAFDKGEIKGMNVGAVIRLDPRFLSPEQREVFPEHWLSSKGLNPDEVAPLLGFKTGDELISNMVKFRELKGESTYQQLKDRAVQLEVKRQMDLKYGDMDEMTTKMAREHVTGLKDEDLIWSEIHAIGQQLGLKPKYSRAEAKFIAREMFKSDQASEQSVIRYARELGRTAAETNAAWSKGDVLGAFLGRQETAIKVALIREAVQFEKRRASDGRIVKQLYKRSPTNMDPEHADWAHDIMLRTEIPTQRDPDHLAETIAQRGSHQTLEDFVNSRNIPVDPNDPAAVGLPIGYQDYDTVYNPNMPIWDKLLDPNFRLPIDKMTVRQYEALTSSLRVLRKLGQDKGTDKVLIEDKEHSIPKLSQQLAAALDSFSEANNPVTQDENMLAKVGRWSKRMSIGLVQYGFFVGRVSRFDPTGIWNEMVFHPGVRAEEHWQNLNDDLKPLVREALAPPKGKDPSWFQKTVENGVFYHPGYMHQLPDGSYAFPFKGEHELNMTNEMLVVLAAITRRAGGLEHAAAGYHLTLDQLKDYMTRVMTKEHYEVADRITNPHQYVQKLEDQMTMKRSGAILPKDPVVKVWTPFGETNSRYYPRIRDSLLSKHQPEVDPHPTQIKVATDAYWTEELTGAIYPQKLSLRDYANDLMRRTRHVAISPYLDVYNKVLIRDEVQGALFRKFGQDYVDMTREFFSDLAGQHGTPTAFEQGFDDFFRGATQHSIVDAVGFNLGTIGKHSPQAVLQTILEDPINTLKAVRDIWKTNSITGQRNLDFMERGGRVAGREWSGSAEVKRRGRYFKDDLNYIADEALGRMTQERKFVGHMAYGGTYTLSTIDSIFSKLAWTARYYREMDNAQKAIEAKALTGPAFNDAVWDAHVKADTLANMAIRETHGSTAITSRSQMLKSQNPLIRAVSPLMNFFNNAVNRRYRAIFMAKDALLNQTPRDRWSDLRTAGKDMFTYFVLPTLIEDMVDPICKADDGYGTCTAKFLAQGIAAPLPIVRDIVHAWIIGHDPSFGIGWNAGHLILKTGKDAWSAWDDDDVNYGKIGKNFLSLYGVVRGLPGAKPAAWLSFGYDAWKGEQEVPGFDSAEDLAKWIRIARWGKAEMTRHEEERQRQVTAPLRWMGVTE